MAYVLGFFTADGTMIKNKRGAHFIEFQITDKKLLREIRRVLGSNHKITTREKNNKKWKTSYRLQIGSKTIFNDLSNLGLTSAKSKTIRLPKVPDRYFSHFVRGYFDGDGNVVSGYFRRSDRKNKSWTLLTRFTSGSKLFLEGLKAKLTSLTEIKGSLLYYGDAWRLSYSTNDSKKLFNFIYNRGRVENLIYLERKHKKFLSAGVA